MKVITNHTIEQLKGNQKAIGRLMALFNKSSFTITRWIEDKDVRLTLPAAMVIIKDETRLTDSQILEEAEKIRA